MEESTSHRQSSEEASTKLIPVNQILPLSNVITDRTHVQQDLLLNAIALQPLIKAKPRLDSEPNHCHLSGMGCQTALGLRISPLHQSKRHCRWFLLVTHVLVLCGREDFVQARLWNDVVSNEDIEASLRGSKNSKSKNRKQFRPGELTFETEENLFYFPSSTGDATILPTSSPTIKNIHGDAELPISNLVSSHSEGKTANANGNSNSNSISKTNSKPDNLFLRHQMSDGASSTRDIQSYRTTRTFLPPTEPSGLTISSSEVSNPDALLINENPPISSSAEESERYVYPKNSVMPVRNPPKGYFNYDMSKESWFGPGYPIFMSDNDRLVVEYANNGWMDFQPPPPIPPAEAMAIANGKTSNSGYSDYFYWDEFSPEGLGFGPWMDTLDNMRDEPNQCGNVGRQSPIDIRPNGFACLEHHQIRTRRGDFRVFGSRNNLDLSIMPNKLRVGVRRRPCKYIDNPVCSEPDPPHADFPHGWPGFVDVLHVDFKFPAEHTIHGRKFDGEMQIYHLHPGRRRLPVVSVLMEGIEDENDRDAGHNEYLQEAIEGFQYEYDANRAQCANAAMGNQNRRLRKGHQTTNGHTSSGKHSPCFGTSSNELSMLDDCPKNKAKHDKGDDQTIEELANTIFEGDQDKLKEYAKLMNHNSSFSLQKDSHRRRLAGIWNPHHESLVPSIYFYGYDGSLTEPPCSEIVSWFVIDETMKISRNQLERMKFLLFTNVDGSTCQSTSTHFKSSVARPIQETGSKRQIWHCTSDNYFPD